MNSSHSNPPCPPPTRKLSAPSVPPSLPTRAKNQPAPPIAHARRTRAIWLGVGLVIVLAITTATVMAVNSDDSSTVSANSERQEGSDTHRFSDSPEASATDQAKLGTGGDTASAAATADGEKHEQGNAKAESRSANNAAANAKPASAPKNADKTTKTSAKTGAKPDATTNNQVGYFEYRNSRWGSSNRSSGRKSASASSYRPTRIQYPHASAGTAAYHRLQAQLERNRAAALRQQIESSQTDMMRRLQRDHRTRMNRVIPGFQPIPRNYIRSSYR